MNNLPAKVQIHRDCIKGWSFLAECLRLGSLFSEILFAARAAGVLQGEQPLKSHDTTNLLLHSF